jgi:hypothetical protein
MSNWVGSIPLPIKESGDAKHQSTIAQGKNPKSSLKQNKITKTHVDNHHKLPSPIKKFPDSQRALHVRVHEPNPSSKQVIAPTKGFESIQLPKNGNSNGIETSTKKQDDTNKNTNGGLASMENPNTGANKVRGGSILIVEDRDARIKKEQLQLSKSPSPVQESPPSSPPSRERSPSVYAIKQIKPETALDAQTRIKQWSDRKVDAPVPPNL